MARTASPRPQTPRARSSRASRSAALLALTLLALVTGLAFAGTGRERGAPTPERAQTARAAAVRVALDLPRFTERVPAEPAEPQPLLAGEEQVHLGRSATRVRIASVGIDIEVRTVGYVFAQGRLQYDVPRVAAGHYVGTAAPGEVGNAVIGGHAATRSGPAVFRDLAKVGVGETVEVFRGDQLFRYSITEIHLVAPGATAMMAQTQDATLTLITCSGDGSYDKRLVLVGKLV